MPFTFIEFVPRLQAAGPESMKRLMKDRVFLIKHRGFAEVNECLVIKRSFLE
jgi:hypothetical protein